MGWLTTFMWWENISGDIIGGKLFFHFVMQCDSLPTPALQDVGFGVMCDVCEIKWTAWCGERRIAKRQVE